MADVRAAVVVTVKTGQEAKGRLAEHLSGADRARLMTALAAHTLAVVGRASSAPTIVVWSGPPPDEAVVGSAAIVPDPGAGPDVAAAAGAARAFAEGADHALVLAADLPLLAEIDVRTLLRAARPRTLVLAPDRIGAGTNALVVPEADFAFAFGPGSRARHTASATARAWAVRLVRTPGLGADLDEPWDLDLAVRSVAVGTLLARG